MEKYYVPIERVATHTSSARALVLIIVMQSDGVVRLSYGRD